MPLSRKQRVAYQGWVDIPHQDLLITGRNFATRRQLTKDALRQHIINLAECNISIVTGIVFDWLLLLQSFQSLLQSLHTFSIATLRLRLCSKDDV